MTKYDQFVDFVNNEITTAFDANAHLTVNFETDDVTVSGKAVNANFISKLISEMKNNSIKSIYISGTIIYEIKAHLNAYDEVNVHVSNTCEPPKNTNIESDSTNTYRHLSDLRKVCYKNLLASLIAVYTQMGIITPISNSEKKHAPKKYSDKDLSFVYDNIALYKAMSSDKKLITEENCEKLQFVNYTFAKKLLSNAGIDTSFLKQKLAEYKISSGSTCIKLYPYSVYEEIKQYFLNNIKVQENNSDNKIKESMSVTIRDIKDSIMLNCGISDSWINTFKKNVKSTETGKYNIGDVVHFIERCIDNETQGMDKVNKDYYLSSSSLGTMYRNAVLYKQLLIEQFDIINKGSNQ